MTVRSCVFVVVALLLSNNVVPLGAQLYKFEDTPIPEVKTLHTMYAFYVYSHQDAPDRSLGSPFVKFHSMKLHSRSAERPNEKLQDYNSVQLSILPYDDFWNLINPSKFCSMTADVEAGLATAPDQLLVTLPTENSAGVMYTHTLNFGGAGSDDKQVPVRKTGVYILIFSNCGMFDKGITTGNVIVKNAYGFLPGNEYYKMPFYGWLSFGYLLLAIGWFGLSMKFWREISHIHGCIGGILFLGLLECFLWWIFFNDWNSSGLRSKILFILAIVSTVVKSVFSYMLVLVASLGWGVTRPYLDQRTIMKIQGICILYIILDVIRETVLSFRHSHTLSMTFVLLCLLPVSLLNGGIFYWIFTALSGLIETLKERGQLEKLLLFQRLWRLLVVSMAIASMALLWQIFDMSRSFSIRWHYQWLFADFITHVLFLVILLVMMYLWKPHQNSARYAYSSLEAKSDMEDRDKAASNAWAEEDLEEGEEEESFWATSKTGGVKEGTNPERIGATVEDGPEML